MLISQADIAHLHDSVIQRMVLRLREGREDELPSPNCFADRLAAALVRALKVRRSTLVGMEWDLLHDDEAEGCIVDAGFDPLDDWGRGWSDGSL
ncbi:MAG: hypothetical protein M3Q22_02590 [Actinomycetota bacterium]|nr:hypothetical protein [Actinomycetota bacterium]